MNQTKDALSIVQVIGREVIDSRGNPTTEAEVVLAGGAVGVACSPSGARRPDRKSVV